MPIPTSLPPALLGPLPARLPRAVTGAVTVHRYPTVSVYGWRVLLSEAAVESACEGGAMETGAAGPACDPARREPFDVRPLRGSRGGSGPCYTFS